ncbi:MAG: dockerin type I domain-containing protein, partial [Candidatus Poribacteria bacterium]
MGIFAVRYWLLLIGIGALTAYGSPPELVGARTFCSRLRQTTFVGSIEAVRVPRLGGEGTYRLHVGSRDGAARVGTIEWNLPRSAPSAAERHALYVPAGGGAVESVVVAVDRPGDYQIVALIRPANARPGSPADVFVRYLRVRAEGSYDSATPFPFDPAYAQPYATSVIVKRQAGIGADETAFSGSLTYHDDNTGFQEPVREARVRLEEAVADVVAGEQITRAVVIAEQFTSADGRFSLSPVPATTDAGEPREYRVRAILDSDALSLQPESGGAYERNTDWADAEAGVSVDLELRWERQDASHMVGHVYNSVLDARDFLLAEVGFTRDKIPVHFPSSIDGTFYTARSRASGALRDEWIEIAFDHGNERTAMLHEYGHAVMTPMYGNRYDTIPFGLWEKPHQLHTISDEEFAISEGWAEFLAAAVDDDALNVTSFTNVDFPNIESNVWYTGTIQSIGRNTIGEKVEGSVASVLWDITDGPQSNDLSVGSDDDGIENDFERLWTIFIDATPYTVLTVRDEWLRQGYASRDELMAIFDTHSMSPLDPSPDVNRDGVVDIADLVVVAQSFGEEGPFGGFSPDVDGNGVVDIIDLVTVARDFGQTIPLAPAAGTTDGVRTIVADAGGRYSLPVGDAAGVSFAVWPPGSVTIGARGSVWAFAENGRVVAAAVGAGSSLPPRLRLDVTTERSRGVTLRRVETVDRDGTRHAHGDFVLARYGTALPSVTALRPNYPNPFNPETWIPFDLARAATVVVTVHDSAG